MVLKQDSSVWATGQENNQVEDGSTISSVLTHFVEVFSSGVLVVACRGHSLVTKQNGSVWATEATYGDTFVNVMSSGAAAVAAGLAHSMVLKQDGSVWAMGWNEHGHLGDGSTFDQMSFVQVVSSGVKAVAAGDTHSMVLKRDGTVWATGNNDCGQLGDGSTNNSNVFVHINGRRAIVLYVTLPLPHPRVLWTISKPGAVSYGA